MANANPGNPSAARLGPQKTGKLLFSLKEYIFKGMKLHTLVFCLCASMAAFIGCGDDSASSAAPTESSPAEPAQSSSSVEKNSSATQNVSSNAVSSSESSAPASSAAVKEPSSSEASAPASSGAEEPTSSETTTEKSSSSAIGSGDDGKCTACDSFTAADPELTENGGKGSVTTYGSITAKETSLGGACNYGQTNIQYYAAIHVNVSPGDEKGPWNGGAACGGCVHVKARTPDGWKEVTVRITDRCPDANCGVDLGGAPASDIMGISVGRYSGEWEFVSCEGVEGVWGDSTSIWVKEGASEFWSIIHVRNPKDMVKSITIFGVDTRDVHELEMVVGTENFWTVPQAVLQTDNRYRIVVKYRTGEDDEWKIKGSDLAEPEANLYLYEHRD